VADGGWRQTVNMTKLIAGLMALALALPALAAPDMPAEVVVEVGGTATIPAPGFQKSQVLDGDKVGFEILPDGVRITGKEIGRTSVFVWDAQQRLNTYQVRVVAPGELGRDRERELMAALDADPLTRAAGVAVKWAGDQVTLTGTVPSAAVKARAAELAGQHAATVDNQLKVAAGPVMTRDTTDGGPLPVIAPPSVSARPGAAPMPALAPLEVKIDDIKKAGRIDLTAGEVRLVSVPTEVKRVMIGTDSVADVVLIPPREVAVIAKDAGETTLMLWYLGTDLFLGQEEKAEIAVNVMAPPDDADDGDLPGLEEIDRVLAQLGANNIEVITSRGTPPRVLLFGKVPSDLMRSKVEQALAALFPTGTPIANFLEVERTPRMNEAQLAAKAAELEKRIAEELPNTSIRVRLHEDELTDSYRVLLTGEASVPAERLRAEQIVEFELGPAQQVTNHITTPLPPPPTDILLAAGGEEPPPLPPIAQALGEAIAAVGINTDRVVMEVDEGRKTVVVRGSVRTEDDQGELLDAIADVLDLYGDWELRDRGLSVAKPRVVTEVQIVELTATDSQNLGVAYGVPINSSGGGGGGTGGTGSQTSGTTIDNSNGLVVYGESSPGSSLARLDPIAARIQALVNNNRGRILQEPYIASDDGEQGTVELVTEVPLPSTTTGTGGTTGTSVEFRPVGIRLMVTPRVMFADPSDRIQLTIETEVSAIDFGVAINIGGSTIPAITNRQAVTTVTVDNGETFVIGGLTSETERKNVSRLPFLSDIPIIGELFKTTETSKEQTTVVVVMTPRINW